MWPAEQVPGWTGRRRWWEVAVPLLLTFGGWTLVVGVQLASHWLYYLWFFFALYGLLLGGAGLIAVALSALGVTALWRLRGPRWAVPVLVCAVLTPLVLLPACWWLLPVDLGY
ncbi:hypothetical protein [Dactylosporangium sp. NPDC005555]|uniref:hypothetical protein n=1 Tax=Dactylosporangium sp. NPDC005555 TaxID=3154889 RepID=UPI0033BA4F7F